ncbi:MAG: acyltransferase [Bacteroidaceae bacterium]|nr:acyltransferase [Bacteroidaceae bacterium]
MRNHSIDTLKCICAIFVIAIHTIQPQEISNFTTPLLRCAVPIFFIISGYFTFGKKDIGQTIRKRLIYMLKIFGWASLFNLLFFIIINGKESINHLYSILSIDSLLFNIVPYGRQLWYIVAYIYVLLLMLFIEKFNLYKLLYWSTPILLIASLLLGKYSEIALDYKTTAFLTRNFLFTGLPFFTIGMLIKQVHTYIHTYTIAILCTIFYILGIIEYCIPGLSNGDLYITNIFLSPALFILFLNITQTKDNILSKIGREDSLYIYILHFHISMIYADYKNIIPYSAYFGTAIVFSVTMFLIYILRKLKIIGRII